MRGDITLETSCKHILETVYQLTSQFTEVFTDSQLHALNCISVYTMELIMMLSFGDDDDEEACDRNLRESVTPILGYAQMLSEGWLGDLPAKTRKSINMIMAQTTAMRDYLIAPDPRKTTTLILTDETKVLAS